MSFDELVGVGYNTTNSRDFAEGAEQHHRKLSISRCSRIEARRLDANTGLRRDLAEEAAEKNEEGLSRLLGC